MDKQFETPLSSRSNSPHSESGFSTLFISSHEELNSSPHSFSYMHPSRSCSLGNGSLPIAGSWTGPASGPLDVHTRGWKIPSFFFPPSISFACLYRLFHLPENFETEKFPQNTRKTLSQEGLREEQKDDLTEKAARLDCSKTGGPTWTSPAPSSLPSNLNDQIPPLDTLGSNYPPPQSST